MGVICRLHVAPLPGKITPIGNGGVVAVPTNTSGKFVAVRLVRLMSRFAPIDGIPGDDNPAVRPLLKTGQSVPVIVTQPQLCGPCERVRFWVPLNSLHGP